jgi:hypothetical protein
MPNNNKIRLTSKAGFDRVNISRLGPNWDYGYFVEGANYGVLFRKMFSINFPDLMKIDMAVFEKLAMVCFVAALKGLYSGSWNGRIHRAPTCDA